MTDSGIVDGELAQRLSGQGTYVYHSPERNCVRHTSYRRATFDAFSGEQFDTLHEIVDEGELRKSIGRLIVKVAGTKEKAAAFCSAMATTIKNEGRRGR
jgi:hypothetical protein